MKTSQLPFVLLSIVLTSAPVAGQPAGQVVVWGTNGWTAVSINGQPLTNVVAISAGTSHALALRSDGTVVAWGDNQFGQTSVPIGLSNVMAVAAGGTHSLALKKNGSLVEWGDGDNRWIPARAGLSNIVAISSGDSHSLALNSAKTLTSWGYEGFGHDAPASLTGVVAIAACPSLAGRDLAIKGDHTVAEWSVQGLTLTGKRIPREENGEIGYVLDIVDYQLVGGLSNAVQVCIGDSIRRRSQLSGPSLALGSDGTVLTWDPSTNDMGIGGTNAILSTARVVRVDGQVLSNVVAIAAGVRGVALKNDGTLVSWGSGAALGSLSNAVAIAARGNSYYAVVTNGVPLRR
jgi:alpha-tubulin suppressor-like RCC1 family protein